MIDYSYYSFIAKKYSTDCRKGVMSRLGPLSWFFFPFIKSFADTHSLTVIKRDRRVRQLDYDLKKIVICLAQALRLLTSHNRFVLVYVGRPTW